MRPLGDNLVMRVEHSLMGLLPLQEAAKELPNYFSVTWGQSRGEKIISKSGWKNLSRNQPCWNSNCRLIASRSVRNKGLFKTKQNKTVCGSSISSSIPYQDNHLRFVNGKKDVYVCLYMCVFLLHKYMCRYDQIWSLKDHFETFILKWRLSLLTQTYKNI